MADRSLVPLLVLIVVAAVLATGGHTVDAQMASGALLVTTDADVVGPSDGLLSLREAVDVANATPGDDHIDLDGRVAVLDRCDEAEGGPYDEDGNVDGDLDANDVAGALTVANGTIEQRCGHRVLDGNVATPLEFHDVTLTGGSSYRPGGAVASYGPVVFVAAIVTGNDSPQGGGVYAPIVVARRSSFTDNAADVDGFGGGAIFATQSVRLVDSVVMGNWAWFGYGGGVRAPEVIIRRSTVAHNEVQGRTVRGGGVWAGRRVVIVDSTVSDNRAPDGPGGVESLGALDVIRSTVVRNESPGVANLAVHGPFTATSSVIGESHGRGVSCRLGGSVTSGGYNVVSVGGRCGLGAGVGDKIRQPRLDLRPLGENGGPTPTHLPLGRRLGIISPSRCGAATDQRGEPRPQGT